ncbi:MAG: T9SS type A sorting domain-containing protein [Candidatus Electryonea clarkiae]|nr:T9SS type A sorting domain-containing protein [Candidatus Electryonea clarkiae]MDP8288806.1 T9SS type A sorting domain-containing protein [Candidatus Electryonea clarkiae]
MKRNLQTLILLMFAFLMANLSFGNGDLSVNYAPAGWLPGTSELNEEFQDSVVYHSFSNEYISYTNTTNYYGGVRFTPQADFQLQGIRLLVNDGDQVEDDIQLSLYTNDNGQPDELIIELWDGEPTSVTLLDGNWNPVPGWVELVLDEEVYQDFEAGEDYWVVLGPIPGPPSWKFVMDNNNQVPGQRSKVGNSATNLTGLCPHDWVINLLGEYAGVFFDVQSVSLYNDIQSFHFAADTEVELSAKFINTGTSDSPEGEVVFTVTDSEDNEVFSNTVDIGAITALEDEPDSVTASETWTPTETDRYIASVTATFEGEDETENNEYQLLQSVVASDDWFIYDDGTFEVSMVPNEGRGWGVSFFPIAYPARIDEISVYFDAAHDATDLRVWTLTTAGEDEVWSYTGEVLGEEWTTIAVESEDYPDGINIEDGFFIAGYVDSDYTFQADNNPPVSGLNPDMPTVSSSIIEGVNYLDDSGNWAMRARISAGVAPQLVFAEDTLTFGNVQTGIITQRSLHITNEGDGIGHVTSINLTPAIVDVFAVVTDLPLEIAPGETDSIVVEWGPVEYGDLVGGMQVFVDDPSFPDGWLAIRLSGHASVTAVHETAEGVPSDYFLNQNFPNPFNPTTEISFGLKENGHVSLSIYNVMGQEVKTVVDESLNAGYHAVVFDANRMSSGIYYYAIQVNDFRSLRKMALIR